MYLDFQKVFETVPHRRLMMKLEAHGIDGDIIKWIGNWLSDKKQKVMLNGQNFVRLESCLEWCPSGISFGLTPFLDVYK